MKNAKHFVWVHGICHGAWSYKVVTLLKSAGHRVTALDLGCSGVNAKRPDEIASLSEYVQPLMDFVASAPEDEKLILVGHSYGGFAISLALECFPSKISIAVYVSTFVPNCISPPAALVQEFLNRTPPGSLVDFQFSFDKGPENPPSSAIFGPKAMAQSLYQHCLPEDLELAKMLARPSGLFLEELSKPSLLTEEKFGSVNRVCISAEEDRLLKKDLHEWFTENSPTKDVKFVAGADRMVILSKPKQFFLCFEEIASTYM